MNREMMMWGMRKRIQKLIENVVHVHCILCRYICGKVFVGHVESVVSVYHKDECKSLQLNHCIYTLLN